MTPRDRTLLYDLVDLPPGNLSVLAMRLEAWGSVLVVRCLHNQRQPVTLTFDGCRGLEWHVLRLPIPPDATAQLITHDLGADQHRRTARLVTTLAEVIVSYGTLRVELG